MSKRLPPSIPALVTGASSGLGAEFARRLAERGHDVTIVARRVDRLEQLRAEIVAAHPVTVSVVGADLETKAGRATVTSLLKAQSPWILVNNAGYGTRGALANLDPARERAEIQLNIVALHDFTLTLLPSLVRAGTGGIINLASTASFQPIPYMATYAASKAFVLHFTEALAEEVRGTGVRVMALCPGPVRSEFGQVAGTEDYMRVARPMTMGVERCVAAALRTFDRGGAVCIPGALNLALAESVRIAPRALIRRSIGTVFGQRP
jgi:short-subunit dehydrogenase